MKRKFLITFVLLFQIAVTFGTHIVGGEFQLIEQRAGLYDIYLNLYFDEVNGNPDAEDQSLTAFIFRKSDNVFMDAITLTNQGKTPVLYDNPDCQISQISTSKIVYAAEGGYQFTLSYNDPAGYYIVWDRCCRNDAIVNIDTPGDVGMLFYLHFPQIFDSNDNLLGWSSPSFATIPGTYACIGESFILDFSASDIDGDSLVYSLSDPLIGNSTSVDPNPLSLLPEPYPTVSWKTGINITNVIPGSPALGVNSATGILTMKPSDGGLHVFSVLCEEFRNGNKIGEVRRDYQIFVYSNCQQNSPPNLSLLLPDNSIYDELKGDTLRVFSENLVCFDLLITDNIDLRNNEKISIKVVPVNFTTDADLINEGDDEFVAGLGDSLTGWQICPPNCDDILENGDPFIYDIIASDDGCPQVKSDTVRVYIELIPEPNVPPVLYAGDPSDSIFSSEIVVEVFEIDTVIIDLVGLDVNLDDLLTISLVGADFRLQDFGIEFPSVQSTGGMVNATFEWIIDCEYFNDTEKDEFDLYFILDDQSCYKQNPDTILAKILINSEENIENFTISNVFTPNGDGINDEFIINSLPRDKCDDQYIGFEIYNRWGKKVYDTSDRKVRFDGAQLNDGVYYYRLEYTESNYKGWFTILR